MAMILTAVVILIVWIFAYAVFKKTGLESREEEKRQMIICNRGCVECGAECKHFGVTK